MLIGGWARDNPKFKSVDYMLKRLPGSELRGGVLNDEVESDEQGPTMSSEMLSHLSDIMCSKGRHRLPQAAVTDELTRWRKSARVNSRFR